jgi:ketosteroid isomerase-like protein
MKTKPSIRTTLCALGFALIYIPACNSSTYTEKDKQSVVDAEKAFAQMAKDSGIARAFYLFADSNAVIKRENDTLIHGPAAIQAYYANTPAGTTVSWSPDFVDISTDGSMGYTYGKYLWRIPRKDSGFTEYKGVFHTVWKKQADGSWKYVWD